MERNAKLKSNSRSLRKNATKEENLLWYHFLRKYPGNSAGNMFLATISWISFAIKQEWWWSLTAHSIAHQMDLHVTGHGRII